MQRFLTLASISLLVVVPPTAAQMGHEKPTNPAHHLVPCDESPTPGKRPPNVRCAILANKEFTSLPKEPIVLRLENFPTKEAAQIAATPASVVVEAVAKIWLLTLGSKGERSQGGEFVTEIGPVPALPASPRYELLVAEADFGPEMSAAVSKAVHTHSGPEIWISSLANNVWKRQMASSAHEPARVCLHPRRPRCNSTLSGLRTVMLCS